MVYYVEWDRIARNKDLHFIRLKCTKTGTLEHHVYVYFIGGDGWNDDFYEPRIEVVYDCTDGLIRRAEIDLEQISVYTNAAKKSYSFEVSNRGKHDLFDDDEAHRKRYKDIPGKNNAYIVDWLSLKQEETLNVTGIFESYNKPEEGCLKV